MRKNCYHLLRPNDNLNMQNDFIFFDTETEITEINDIFFGDKWELSDYKQELRLGWAIYWNRIEDKKEYFYFENGKEFINFLEEKAEQVKKVKRFKKEILVYAHNTQFDFNIVNGYSELIANRNWKISKIYIEGKIFILELEKHGMNIRIYDTFNYIDRSLKIIGKSLGLEKMEVNLFTDDKEKIKEYCKNDTEIVFLFVKKLIEFLEVNNLSRLKPTSASLAFNSFKHAFYDFKNKPIEIHNHSNVIELERKSYKGGICDLFYCGKFNLDLLKLDINSMYPAKMREKEVPIKNIGYFENNGTNYKNIVIGLMKDSLVIADCDFYLPKEYAYILLKFNYKKDDKTGFLHGDLKGVLTSPEIDFILKYGKIKRIKEFAIYKKALIFDKYVNFFYSKRLEYENILKNPIFALLSKQFLNSLYGKFAAYSSDVEIEENLEKVENIYSVAVTEEVTKDNFKSYNSIRIGTNRINISKCDVNSYDSFVAISSFITAYARMYLIEIILQLGRKNLFYCDTDSLIIKKESLKNIDNYIDKGIIKELGKLKIEDESKYSEFIRPKYYLFNNELKCKGVKKIHTITHEDDNIIVIKQEQFQKFKTALRKEGLGSQRITTMKKELNKNYDKGIVLDDKTVIPYSNLEVTLN